LETSLRSDSIVTLVATANGEDPIDRVKGWGLLDELAFQKSFSEAKGKLGIRRSNAELPLPWKNALPVLVVKAAELGGESAGDVLLKDVELVVPYKADS